MIPTKETSVCSKRQPASCLKDIFWDLVNYAKEGKISAKFSLKTEGDDSPLTKLRDSQEFETVILDMFSKENMSILTLFADEKKAWSREKFQLNILSSLLDLFRN